MPEVAQQSRTSKPATAQAKQTTLQRTLTQTLNDLGVDAALVAMIEREDGPLIMKMYRGFAPREARAILRSVSHHDLGERAAPGAGAETTKSMRLRLITPSAKSLFAIPLLHRRRVYGLLVVGRREGASISKKERGQVETAADDISGALERAALFDGGFLLGRSWVLDEPSAGAPSVGTQAAASTSVVTPQMQEAVVNVLEDAASQLAFERAWAASYDPIAGAVEVLGIAGDLKGDPKKALKPGQRLGLDESASGWVVRHRKPRVDHDLASTQGRFLDHKPLYKDHYRSTLVVPFFVRGQVGGTVTLASKGDAQYGLADARTLEPLLEKLADVVQQPAAPEPLPAGEDRKAAAEPAVQAATEPYIRKQERQAALAELGAFLAAEVREPLASIRAQLEDLTGEGILDFDPQVRVESAMRDLIRVETILNEILDFTKPLELKRRLCRLPDIIENALTLIATDLEINRITVRKDYAQNLRPARIDDAKIQGAFLSIFKNALEAMSPGGQLDIQTSMHRAGRNQEVQILIKNDGVPIPPELVDKVFEPYFTTKRSGTGLGLATVKKLVEEHHGHIAITSQPDQGTAVAIRLPASGGGARRPFRHRGRGRRTRRAR